MKIISWNVNGIRASYNKGLKHLLDLQNADIVCLQEIKANIDQFPPELTNQYKYIYSHPAKKRGYSGVALICKAPPLKVTNGIGSDEYDFEGRVITAEFEKYFVINCYFPNGQRDHARVPFKMKFCHLITKYAQNLMKKSKKQVIICGDYNTAHHPIDLANPKSNINTTGFLPIERQWMDEFMQAGFVDVFRHLNPTEIGAYTWWTYRGDCRPRNIGWRIDYFFVNSELVTQVKKCYHLPEQLGSDHCPIVLIIE